MLNEMNVISNNTKETISTSILEIVSTLKVVSKALENTEDTPNVICDASVVMDMTVGKLLNIVSTLEQ